MHQCWCIYAFVVGPDDYTSQIQIVTFRSQDATQSVRVPILEDRLAERLERFTVTLIPVIEGVVLSTNRRQATVEIIDNDGESDFRLYCMYSLRQTLYTS